MSLASIDRDDLRATVTALASIDRPPASAGEEQAAHWIAEQLRARGCDVRIEEERAYTNYARSIAGQSAVGLGGALLVALGVRARVPRARRVGALVAALAGAGIVEEVSNGPQLFRRIALRRRPAWNVVAEAGDRSAGRTLVVLAHHDAAPSGLVFDQTVHRAFAKRFPDVVERTDTAIPIWWPVLGGPLAAIGAALTRSRRLSNASVVLGATAVAAFVDIERSPHVPGANDNLTAVAALLEIARVLDEEPVDGLRVLLVSAGAEESLQGGIRAFARRHFGSLPPERTTVLNLDTIGSPQLVLLEGEGPFRMEDYTDPSLRDRVARIADGLGVPVRRGMRARASTDGVIPSRAGYPTATIVSVDETKAIPNYHLMTDVPENVDYESVAGATAIAVELARELAAGR